MRTHVRAKVHIACNRRSGSSSTEGSHGWGHRSSLTRRSMSLGSTPADPLVSASSAWRRPTVVSRSAGKSRLSELRLGRKSVSSVRATRLLCPTAPQAVWLCGAALRPQRVLQGRSDPWSREALRATTNDGPLPLPPHCRRDDSRRSRAHELGQADALVLAKAAIAITEASLAAKHDWADIGDIDATSSMSSRRAAASGVSPGSIRPPGGYQY